MDNNLLLNIDSPSSGTMMAADIKDTCSLATLNDFTTSHLEWFVTVDFESQTLACEVKQKYQRIRENIDNVIILDSKDLEITSVTANGQSVEYKLLKSVRNLGQGLEIHLPEIFAVVGCEFELIINYKTSPNATAIQWMSPAQTLGKFRISTICSSDGFCTFHLHSGASSLDVDGGALGEEIVGNMMTMRYYALI